MKPFKKEKHKRSNAVLAISGHNDNDDEYYCDDDYDCCFYHYRDDDETGTFSYVYISDLDIFINNTNGVQYDGYGDNIYEIYVDPDDVYHIGVHSYHNVRKIEAFFGCVAKAVFFGDVQSIKIKKLYNLMCERYPEIYFKLIGKFGYWSNRNKEGGLKNEY